MSGVKRYEHKPNQYAKQFITAIPDGTYVTASDYDRDTQALKDELEHAEQWRSLALQFDGHRMRAMALLRVIGTDACQAFLAEPPISALEITAANQRLEGKVARLTLAIANQTVRHFVGYDDQRQMDELVAAGIRADQQEIKRLREAVREFAGFFSSDDPKHWELHGLADGADYSAALTTNGEVTG